MRIQCPNCKTKYDVEKDCHIPLSDVSPEKTLVVTISCSSCGQAFDAKIKNMGVREWVRHPRAGNKRIAEVKSRG